MMRHMEYVVDSTVSAIVSKVKGHVYLLLIREEIDRC